MTIRTGLQYESSDEDNEDTFDIFHIGDQVGDIVSVAVDLDLDSFMNDENCLYDVTLAYITNIVHERYSHYRVTLQSVYAQHLCFNIRIEPGMPYVIETSDFIALPEVSLVDVIGTGKKASKTDMLAKREALYDYEIAALALSENFLKTRNKAYKRIS